MTLNQGDPARTPQGNPKAERDPRFVEAAFQEMAQGRFAKNESLWFAQIPEYLMSESEWAWLAGYKAGHVDGEQKVIRELSTKGSDFSR